MRSENYFGQFKSTQRLFLSVLLVFTSFPLNSSDELITMESMANSEALVYNIDIDGNGEFDALTDGLLILRNLFGLTDSSLVSGALAADAIYMDSTEISASLNKNGDRFVYGRKHGNDRQVWTYKHDTTNGWVSNGILSGSYNYFGSRVSMSDDGLRIAFKTHEYNSSIGTTEGKAVVYEDAGSQQWSQIGQSISYEGSSHEGQKSMILSGDGSTIAVARQITEDCSNYRGRVQIYRYNGSSWIQIGSDIIGILEDRCGASSSNYAEYLGRSLALSSNGNRIVLGAPFHGTSDTGRFVVYDFEGSTWTQKDDDLFGTLSVKGLGHKVDISDDGSRVLIGSYSRSDDHTETFSVYKLSAD